MSTSPFHCDFFCLRAFKSPRKIYTGCQVKQDYYKQTYMILQMRCFHNSMAKLLPFIVAFQKI
jgi:hypothetical protein